ncbi:hypothetical protein ABN763_17485 [Spongiivirga sp. MCCC 1A20706]|uniref:hypothetical protein n=1 Tax=Spongiivirga sp. MCCC 1A20706 TaxID=3160963 RepID=UPI0039779AA8
MIIRFKKSKDKSTLHCIRNDGSTTWTTIHKGMEIHDLAHFAVEITLGYKNAFYGLLNEGFTIQDFGLSREKRPKKLLPKNLPKEALQTEHIVNLLQIQYQNKPIDFDIISALKPILTENQLPFPSNLDQLNAKVISKKLDDLMNRWENLEQNGILALEFDIT